MVRIAVCDDDRNDRENVCGFLREYLNDRGLEAEVRSFDHPDTLITECEEYRPHIYILDIVMPMVTGIEAARELRWNQPEAQIIFATSESSYALESFDVNPINYIMKPVDRDKLFATLDLALSRVKEEDEESLTVKIKGGYRTIRTRDLMYVDYRNHVVFFHLSNGEEVQTPTLRIGFSEYMEDNISSDYFVRCHESIAVNIAAIDKLTKTSITLRNKEEVPVSKSRYAEVAERYLDYRL
ncbi:response regulator of the LytR/AlgR family [Lachnospiraceae bacterium JC7]|nr:response regulator of the LytR/AlgR family [Lachnospiraceae bacterium JC7]